MRLREPGGDGGRGPVPCGGSWRVEAVAHRPPNFEMTTELEHHHHIVVNHLLLCVDRCALDGSHVVSSLFLPIVQQVTR